MNSTSGLQTPLAIGQAEIALQHIRITRYTTAAAVVVLIYDTLLTFGDEVRLVWPGSLTVAKLLYYIIRYVSIVGVVASNYHIAGIRSPLSPDLCRTWLGVTGSLQTITSFATTAMFCLRMVALYDHVNWVRCMLWVSLALSYVTSLALMGPAYKLLWKTLTYFPLTDICLLPDIPSYLYAIYLSPTPFEVLVSLLVVIKACENMATLRSPSDTPILFAMIRDSLLHFLAITMFRVLVSILWTAFPVTMVYLGTNANWAFESTLLSRFFLNLRSVAYDNPLAASHATTGFALDSASPRALMTKIMGRKPVSQNAQGTLEEMEIRRRGDEEDMVDISGGRTSVPDIDREAGREMVELRTTEGHEV